MFEYNPLDLAPVHMDVIDREIERFYLPEATRKEPCQRCNGKGILPHFSHIMGGICFRCWGIGEEMSAKERQKTAQIVKANRV